MILTLLRERPVNYPRVRELLDECTVDELNEGFNSNLGRNMINSAIEFQINGATPSFDSKHIGFRIAMSNPDPYPQFSLLIEYGHEPIGATEVEVINRVEHETLPVDYFSKYVRAGWLRYARALITEWKTQQKELVKTLYYYKEKGGSGAEKWIDKALDELGMTFSESNLADMISEGRCPKQTNAIEEALFTTSYHEKYWSSCLEDVRLTDYLERVLLDSNPVNGASIEDAVSALKEESGTHSDLFGEEPSRVLSWALCEKEIIRRLLKAREYYKLSPESIARVERGRPLFSNHAIYREPEHAPSPPPPAPPARRRTCTIL
jgi:hypothetical protein